LWRFKYRFAGKEKRISLGVYPDVGLKKARDRRDEMRKLVADGIDPSAARKQEKLMALDAALSTFEAVAREWFEKHSPNWEAQATRRSYSHASKPMSFRGWGTAQSATSRRRSFCPCCAGSKRAACSRPRTG
jgi:Arm DNA-binding domain